MSLVLTVQAVICKHCRREIPNNRPRGLCSTCYNSPGIREAYPAHPTYGRRELIPANTYPTTLPEPTDALPGTQQKCEILERRASAGLVLFHPQDATIHDG